MKSLMLILVSLLLANATFSQKVILQQPGIQQIKSIRFFPNPASTTVTFEFNQAIEKGYSLQVYSFLGRQVLTVPVTGPRISINVSDLMKGVYVFQVRNSSGQIVATNKFQVSR
ncbi:MAG: T9SS type A sorting domain-containing protein [Bacteroidota bacterium]